MTNLDNIDVPREAVLAADKSLCETLDVQSALRAALQAWVDCGRARVGAGCIDDINDEGDWLAEAPPYSVPEPEFPVLILRLDPIAKEPSDD